MSDMHTRKFHTDEEARMFLLDAQLDGTGPQTLTDWEQMKSDQRVREAAGLAVDQSWRAERLGLVSVDAGLSSLGFLHAVRVWLNVLADPYAYRCPHPVDQVQIIADPAVATCLLDVCQSQAADHARTRGLGHGLRCDVCGGPADDPKPLHVVAGELNITWHPCRGCRVSVTRDACRSAA